MPLGSATAFTESAQETRAVNMALTTLQPLREEVHRRRFPGGSLFSPRRRAGFDSLRRRGLLEMDEQAGTVTLREVYCLRPVIIVEHGAGQVAAGRGGSPERVGDQRGGACDW